MMKLADFKDITVAVTKNRTDEEIRSIYEKGYHVLAENRVQELEKRQQLALPDVQWHLIGHLQSNKVRKAVTYCTLIQSVDSERLLRLIDREAGRQNRVMSVLLQVNIAQEDTKFGFEREEVSNVIRKVSDLENVRIEGIMVIGPHVDDEERIRDVFRQGRQLFEELKNIQQNNLEMKYLSMGMSADWQIALQCGSNMLRIGRSLFE
ncbi:MAG: YggS family pyridoxal phosphate-dependent enzyme [Erysipelotrichaceae bacterium]|nr:YggS family pyridoxal phosphate-dependent enzyme [Erysipelotrichaceae bacterium]